MLWKVGLQSPASLQGYTVASVEHHPGEIGLEEEQVP